MLLLSSCICLLEYSVVINSLTNPKQVKTPQTGQDALCMRGTVLSVGLICVETG